MVLLHTPPKAKNFRAPDFSLKNIDNSAITLDDCMGEHGVVVMFICNHCPYVLAIIDRLVSTCTDLQKQGIGCVAIMSNDTEKYPADSFENMHVFAKKHDFTFPYLIDEAQTVAKSYDAVCTPDFFGFDKNKILQYRGRLDSTGANKNTDETTKQELFDAMICLKGGMVPPSQQHASMGCSIKWKE